MTETKTTPTLDDLRVPEEFSFGIYTDYPGNKELSESLERLAQEHYRASGREEGKVCSLVENKRTFLDVIPRGLSILEIGPFFNPAFSKSRDNVEFMDVFSTEELRKKAGEHNGNPANVPEIDYVWKGGPYFDLVKKKFDCVFSSHSIEHQPCLIKHLNEVSSVLKGNGRYFVVAPDKRYCFDSFFPESTIADVLDAFVSAREVPAPRAIFRGWLLTTHNDAKRHWAGDRPGDTLRQPVTKEYGLRVKNSVTRFKPDAYIDCHAWQFTPDSFAHLVQLVCAAELTDMEVEAVYPTLKNTFEFYAVLRRRRTE